MVNKLLAQIRGIKKPATYAVTFMLGMLAAIAVYLMTPGTTVKAMPSDVSSVAQLLEKQAVESQLPALLTEKDQRLYREIFAAQDNGNWKQADALSTQLGNKKLMGHVLAERYLHPDYESTSQELEAWLKDYSDHPQAHSIYVLASRKNPHLDMPYVAKQRALEGYGDDSGLAKWSETNEYAGIWQEAIEAWRQNNIVRAANLFSELAAKHDLHEWRKSASAFWAWRAYEALGSKKQAVKFLYVAASYPRTFYGVLARQKLGHSLGIDKTPNTLSDSEVLEMMGDQSIRRIISLSSIGANDLAEMEIRHLFPSASPDEKYRLLAIAGELNLASAQIAMAKRLSNEHQPLDFARYPIPNWQPHAGFSIDPALIYAMARQESGFRVDAVSHAGAGGVMQLMPHTASLMKKRALKGPDQNLVDENEPITNMTLGQQYVEHLLDTPMVENNLLYLLTAYNAGPGRLQQWKKDIDYHNDPLLFLESIPFNETRSYVMQVMTNYWIYSEIIGTETKSRQALLHNQWPDYERPSVPVASATSSAQAS